MNGPSGKIPNPDNPILELDERSREIFRHIVDGYLTTGDPLGSRTLSRQLSVNLSPATIRNVMSDLEMLGLVYAPHTSAGRMPTDIGLRFFVDSFLEIGNLGKEERASIETQMKAVSSEKTFDNVLTEASQLLSGLSHTAGLVVTTKADLRLKHIEFIRLEPTKALAVIVGENGSVENRIITLPAGITASSLTEAANFINAKIAGQTIAEANAALKQMQEAARLELDELTQKLVNTGIATWAGSADGEPGQLIISGHANLLGNLEAADDLDRIRVSPVIWFRFKFEAIFQAFILGRLHSLGKFVHLVLPEFRACYCCSLHCRSPFTFRQIPVLSEFLLSHLPYE